MCRPIYHVLSVLAMILADAVMKRQTLPCERAPFTVPSSLGSESIWGQCIPGKYFEILLLALVLDLSILGSYLGWIYQGHAIRLPNSR